LSNKKDPYPIITGTEVKPSAVPPGFVCIKQTHSLRVQSPNRRWYTRFFDNGRRFPSHLRACAQLIGLPSQVHSIRFVSPHSHQRRLS